MGGLGERLHGSGSSALPYSTVPATPLLVEFDDGFLPSVDDLPSFFAKKSNELLHGRLRHSYDNEWVFLFVVRSMHDMNYSRRALCLVPLEERIQGVAEILVCSGVSGQALTADVTISELDGSCNRLFTLE